MSTQRRAMLRMLLCAMLWSLGGMLIKLIPWNAFLIAAARSLIAGILIFAYLRIARIPLRWNRQTLLIAIGMAGTFFSFVGATKLTTAANAIVIQYTGPLFLLAFNILFRGQRPRPADLLAALFSVAGICVFLLDELGGGTLAGNLVALLSALFFTMVLITTGDGDETDRMNGILQGQILTAVLGLPFLFAALPVVTGQSLLYLLALGVFQLGVSYVLYMLALRDCPPLACSLLGMIEPLLNPVWVFLTVGEAPGLLSLAGGLFVIAVVTVYCIYNEKHPPVLARPSSGKAPG